MTFYRDVYDDSGVAIKVNAFDVGKKLGAPLQDALQYYMED